MNQNVLKLWESETAWLKPLAANSLASFHVSLENGGCFDVICSSTVLWLFCGFEPNNRNVKHCTKAQT